jgi:CheY-like chemotaxis protein
MNFNLSSNSGKSNASSDGVEAENRHLVIKEIKAKQYRILVIDDDDRFRKSLCFLLRKKFGAQVEDVDSGQSAIERLNAGNRYDLIFTDIMMPGLTGMETYYEIRKINLHIPIVIMSAYSDSEEWKKALTLTDITLFPKPIPEDKLIEILSKSTETHE